MEPHEFVRPAFFAPHRRTSLPSRVGKPGLVKMAERGRALKKQRTREQQDGRNKRQRERRLLHAHSTMTKRRKKIFISGSMRWKLKWKRCGLFTAQRWKN
jgi:hypothetical protein